MIEIHGLTKRYGEQTVLDGIDLSVAAGEIAAIVGPSGAGKSTLARCINLLERPTAGSISVHGQDLTSLREADLRRARRAIGTVFQSAGLLSRLTAADNVALPLRYVDIPDSERHERVRRLLDRVGMLYRANYYPSQLSGGQRQRIGLARGLVLEPPVLLADEPTSGLDPATTASILSLLASLRDELGVAVVLITHEMDVVRSVADTVAQLDHGRIVTRGRVAEVVRGSDSPLSRALLPTPPVGAAAGDGGRVWHLRYDRADVPATWLSQVSRELDVDIAVRSGLIEALGDGTAGRVVVEIESPVADERLRAAFAARGIAAEPGDGRQREPDHLETAALVGAGAGAGVP
ncbi:MAG TPA: methionine ABC transporter ATP-binding protein [Solirubrobacteraceae bacterium]|jgi:ABC-type methionine transport system ATPase subunit